MALVITATAAGIISAFLRGILARVEKEQLHQFAALRLLNQAALFRTAPTKDTRLVYSNDKSLQLIFPEPNLPEAKVENFQPDPSTLLPPITIAFTPYQRYSLSQDRYTLTFLQPSLPSPVARGQTVAKPLLPTTPAAAAAGTAISATSAVPVAPLSTATTGLSPTAAATAPEVSTTPTNNQLSPPVGRP